MLYEERTIEELIEDNLDYETSLQEVSGHYSELAQFNSETY